MKKILIDTNSINGRRSALIEGDKLLDFDLEFEGNNFQKGSIHKGKITKIEGSLEAIFVELGSSRHGFLPFKELSAEYFDPSIHSNAPLSFHDSSYYQRNFLNILRHLFLLEMLS